MAIVQPNKTLTFSCCLASLQAHQYTLKTYQNQTLNNKTMTTQAAFNGYLNNQLNITSLAMRTVINDQGLTRIDDFIGLTDQDIKDLCDNIWKPGGTIPNPNATVASQPPTITNPGQPISFVSIKRLRMLNYNLHHPRRIQRDLNEGEVLPARLTMIWNLREDEKRLKDEDWISS